MDVATCAEGANPPEDAVDAEQECLAPLAPSAASSLVEVEI